MDPLLQVCLLGPFRLLYEGIELNSVKTPRLQSLLAFVILHNQAPVSRQQLAGLFWPDTSESQSRTNLRNLIHQLRQALPEFDLFIDSDADVLKWLPESPFKLDVTEFEHCLEGLAGKALRREALEKAIAIYRGDLLPSCYGDWIIPERERLRIKFIHGLETLAEMAEESREYPAALQYTTRLLLADSLYPTANQQLIRLHALLGDRPAALKAYQAYSDLLQIELGIAPDPETQDLYERIRQARDIIPKPAATSATRLVGRKAEWVRLRSIWQAASRGSPQVVFISGEAGIGKTRLAEELANWAALQGIRSASANCYPAEGSLPYAPVLSWLRAQPLPAMEKTWLVEIARLMPEILQKNPGLPRGEPLREPWQRQRLFEALARAVLAKRQGLILILEDIHWCDQDTLEWLHFLLRFDSKAPLLVAATVRSGEILPDHPLATLQAALRNERRYTEIELSPLNESETLELIGQTSQELSGISMNPEAASQIFREAEGNPLFAIEMVRLGQSSGIGVEAGHLLGDSERVKAVLSNRISQLSPEARQVACLASAIGREFSLDVLYQASGESGEQIVRAIDEMLQRRIIREISPDTYDFTHDKLRQAAFSGLSAAHRRLVHRKAAEAYQRLDESAEHPRNAQIASHYEQAGLYLPAIEHYRLAAESAGSIFANAEAQRYLQRAVELAETLGVEGPNGLPPRDFAGLLERWGDMLAKNGKYPLAQSAFERALAQPYDRPRMQRSQLYRKISSALIPQYQHQQAHVALDQAEQAIGPVDPEGTKEEIQEWIQIQLDRSQVFYWSNCPEQMDAIIQKIQPFVETSGSLDQQINLLNQQCLARIRRERYRFSLEMVELGQRVLELAETLGDPLNLALAQFQLGFGLLWYGDPRAAREWLARGYEATGRMGARLWQARCLAYLSVASRKLGDLEALRQQTRDLLDLSMALDEPTYHGIGLANQGWLAWKEGNGVLAEQLCKSAYEDWDKFGGDVFHALAGWVLLAIAISQRDLERARSAAMTLLDPNPAYRPVQESTGDLLSRALSAFQAGQGEAAYTFFDQALERARESQDL